MKLKIVIDGEIKHVTKALCDCEENNHIERSCLKSWLQSLQRIEKCCKDRNRY